MSSYRWEDVVGPTLLKCNGEEVPTSLALSGKKYVMLYMSAHWCPPCRHFTPQLVAAYEAHKRYLEEGRGGDFNANTDDDSVGEIEVIFVSFDSVKSEHDNYRNTMPWLSVPFANLHLQIKDILSKKYSIVGIPALVIIDGNSGKLVSTNGRELYIDYFKGEYPSTSSSWGCILS